MYTNKYYVKLKTFFFVFIRDDLLIILVYNKLLMVYVFLEILINRKKSKFEPVVFQLLKKFTNYTS